MIAFKEELLTRIRAQLEDLPAPAREDVIDNDVGLIEDQLQRYERRLEFWYARQWLLEGLVVDEEAKSVTYRERSISLTRRELQLFMLLVARSPNFTTPKQLLVQGWHDARLPEETLRTYIARLRAKVQKLGVEAEIVNQPRHGYALVFKDHPKPSR